MINFSRSSNCYPDSYPAELIGTEISTRPIKLPRHISSISSWGSKLHRNISNSNKIEQVSKTYRLAADPSEATNLAVNILRYQLSDRASKQKHLENVYGNLEHRLEVAQANKNQQLVNILREEFKQLQAGIQPNL
jgi:hypothetical protein